jgi:hypothetical protein
MEYCLSNPHCLTLHYLTLGTSICPRAVPKTDLTTLGNCTLVEYMLQWFELYQNQC